MNRTNGSHPPPPDVEAGATDSKGEPERSSSTTETSTSPDAGTKEIVVPVEDQANADSDPHTVAGHDAVSEICDAERTANANQHVAELDGAHQNQIESVEQTQTAIQQPTTIVVEAIVEHDNRHIPNGSEISPGKISLSKEVHSVARYAAFIGESWRSAVEAIMEVARLCVDASERLTAAQKSELITKLPFGAATFSKLVQIGTDTRLHTQDVQRLLPPHYTRSTQSRCLEISS